MATHLTSPTNRAAARPVGSVVDIPLLDGATNAGRTGAGRTGAGTGAGIIDVAVRQSATLDGPSQQYAAVSTDIARTGAAEQYSGTDIALLSDLIVSFVVTMAERLVEDPDSEARTLAQARTQLRMLLVGALNWRSDRT